MAHIILENVNVYIPVYDANALRLFRSKRQGAKGKVGSHDFDSSGVLRVKALSDVSLTFRDGDRVALIGHNGAGKSSLLRYIAGIYPVESGTRDTEGSVYIYGGTTMIDPDASGYENISLAMRIGRLPLSMEKKYKQDISEFTELGEYLNMPTRIYSAGMNARLSFAIATMHTPDILLIDEGIGAGDASFTQKVEKRIKDFTNKAKIILFASHSDDFLRKMCNKGVVLNGGKVDYVGEIDDAISHYENIRGTKNEPSPSSKTA